jgi:hypothetical protein
MGCRQSRSTSRAVSGETIAETLIAILIVGLATALFAVMVSTATLTLSESQDAVDAVYRQTSTLDAATSSTSTTVTVTGAQTTWCSAWSTTLSVDAYTAANSVNGRVIARYEIVGG